MKTKKNYTKETRDNAEFEARISRVVKEFSNEQESVSLEEIESWVARDNMKKRDKRKKIMSIAACFIIICGMGLTMRFYANADNSVVMAGGDDEPVVINGTFESSEEVHTTWETVLEAREKYPDMLVPEYVPEGYKFKELKVEKNSGGNKYCFIYINSERQTIEVKEKTGMEDTLIADYDGKLSGKNGTIYLKSDGNAITATSILKKVKTDIICKETSEELVKIMDELKSGS